MNTGRTPRRTSGVTAFLLAYFRTFLIYPARSSSDFAATTISPCNYPPVMFIEKPTGGPAGYGGMEIVTPPPATAITFA